MKAPPGSLEALREGNRQRVIATLRRQGAASRAEIARITGLSRSTVSVVVADLISQGLAQEQDETVRPSGGTGRPGVAVTLDPSAGAALGIDIGRGGVRAVVTDLAHATLADTSVSAQIEAQPYGTVIGSAVDIAQAALAQAGVPADRVVGAAVAVPSPVDPESGVVGAEAGVPSLAGQRPGPILEERLGLRVSVENDANLCALAETMWGAARGHDTLVYMKLSEGIGAGLIISGRLHRGLHGAAGEIGHMPVVPEGALCRCGNRGCLEAVAGTTAIVENAAAAFAHVPEIGEVVEKARSGDALCRRALRDAGGILGTAIGQILNIVAPSIVVLGGDLVAGWPFMEAPLREAVDRAAIDSSARGLVVTPSTISQSAEALGAVALVLRESGQQLSVG